MLISQCDIPTRMTSEMCKYFENPIENEPPTFTFKAKIVRAVLERNYLLLVFLGKTGEGYFEVYLLTGERDNLEFLLVIRQTRALRKNGHIDIRALRDYDYKISCKYHVALKKFQVEDVEPIQSSYWKNTSEAMPWKGITEWKK